MEHTCDCDNGWICEEHPDKPWPHDDCAGPGMPCDVCNSEGRRKPAYDEVLASTKEPFQNAIERNRS